MHNTCRLFHFPAFLRYSLRLPALFVLLIVIPLPAFAVPLKEQVAGEIRSILDRGGSPRLVLGRELLLNPDLLPGYYLKRGFAPVWVGDLGLTDLGRQLLDRLRSAEEHGLFPENYHLQQIDPLIGLEEDSRRYGILFDPAYMARLDLLLTDAFLLYAAHLVEGRVDPEEVHEAWRARPRKVDLLHLLDYALNNHSLVSVLNDLAPPHRGYLLLREELERYRGISARGGWPMVPGGAVLRPGGIDPRLPLLRDRLQYSGDLPENEVVEGNLFDGTVVAALVRFQRRHGLNGDGVLGPKTLAALNVSAETRIRQIELNLERWRWLPKEFGDRHLQINIADFQLAVMEGEAAVLTMPVVVGTAYRKTPVFSANMSHLIFSPYWNVPETILREDKLPKIKANPRYVEQQHYEIVRGTEESPKFIDPLAISWRRVTAATLPGQLRQKPGPWNPLGRVKFMFPNGFDVYVHDTPDKHLFGRDARTFSSGCIRIPRPVDLACYLLEGQGWSRERIQAAMARNEPLRVGLVRSFPVHILYWTAWVDAEGVLQLREDIYLRDLDLELALYQRREKIEHLTYSGQRLDAFAGR